MNKKILIVDDIDFNVEFESKLINNIADEKNIEISIDTASNVSDAINLIENNTYDALVIDMHLPDGTGIDIAKRAREKDSEAKIAALTIYPSEYEEYKEYFDLFLKKPIMIDSYKDNFIKLLQI
jgi:CheY-like chemotaxis protein